MKKIVAIIFLFMLSSIAYSQMNNKTCRVLLKELQGEYKGGCKKGLAHGQGTTKGVNSYEGRFKKGYPHGEGKYIWDENTYYEGHFRKGKKNGFGKYFSLENTGDSITEGYWENDVYIGKIENPKQYNTIYKSSVERVTYFYKGDGGGRNDIMIKFNRSGARQIMMVANNGIFVNQDSRYGYENVSIPFKVSMTFIASGKFGAGGMNCKLDFEILKEGCWDVIIHF